MAKGGNSTASSSAKATAAATEDGQAAASRGPETGLSERHVVALSIHATIKACQSQNGLRHGDYLRYRQYCTRRLRRVRTRQDVRFSLGKGKTFIQRTLIAEDVKTPQHLFIPLLMAERAWAYAMALKQHASGGGVRQRVSHHLERRLAKAAKWATQLENLCAATGDERTAVEGRAYAAWMRGSHALEREEWAAALEAFSAAHGVCAQLGSVGAAEDQDLFTLRAEEIEPNMRYCAYNLELASGGDNSGGGADALLAAKLEAVLAAERKKQAKALDHVEWRGAAVPVRTEAVAVALLKAREAEAALAASGDGRESLYLRCISAYDDAASAAAAEAAGLQGRGGGGGAKSEEQRRELAALGQFLRHGKLRLMLRRNERLVESLKVTGPGSAAIAGGGGGAGSRSGGGGSAAGKQQVEDAVRQNGTRNRNQKQLALQGSGQGAGGGGNSGASAADIVHVYDALLQNVRDMRAALAGRDADAVAAGVAAAGVAVNASSAAYDDGDDDYSGDDADGMAARAAADEARYRAWRCYYLAEAYASDEKWRQAAVLFDHAQELCADAAGLAADVVADTVGAANGAANGGGGGDGGSGACGASDLARLDAIIKGAKCRATAHAFLLAAREDDSMAASLRGLDLGGGTGSGGGEAKGGEAKGGRAGGAPAAAAHARKSKNKRKYRNAAGRNAAAAGGGDTGDSASGDASEGGRTLLQRLNDYDAGAPGDPRVAQLPPAVAAVPCKPLLLDEALNYIEFPNLDARAGVASASAAAAGGSGIRGWVGWALGR